MRFERNPDKEWRLRRERHMRRFAVAVSVLPSFLTFRPLSAAFSTVGGLWRPVGGTSSTRIGPEKVLELLGSSRGLGRREISALEAKRKVRADLFPPSPPSLPFSFLLLSFTPNRCDETSRSSTVSDSETSPPSFKLASSSLRRLRLFGREGGRRSSRVVGGRLDLVSEGELRA